MTYGSGSQHPPNAGIHFILLDLVDSDLHLLLEQFAVGKHAGKADGLAVCDELIGWRINCSIAQKAIV